MTKFIVYLGLAVLAICFWVRRTRRNEQQEEQEERNRKEDNGGIVFRE